jgi:hypothetical protein
MKWLRRILRVLAWPFTGEVEHRRPDGDTLQYQRRDDSGGGAL